MSDFLEDPSVLTKDKLKSELLANSVTLPSGEHRKDVYIQLYLQNLTTRNTAMNRAAPEAFSSDEEQAAPVASSRNRSGRVGSFSAVIASCKATKKTDKPQSEDLDVTQLTPEELKDELIKYGFQPGPVLSSTRKLYEKKLQKLLDEGPLESQPAPPAPAPAADNNQNGNTDSDQYSDKEQEEMPKPVLEKREPLKSKAKPPASLRTRRLEQKRESEEEGWRDTIETPPARQTKIPRPAPVALLDTALLEMEGRIAGGDYVEQTQERDILKEMFPNQVATPTGISATCRRPIRGAAGRPLDSSSFRLDDSLLLRSQTSYHSNLRTESFKPASPAFTAAKTNSNSSTFSSTGGSAPSRRSFPVWIRLLLLSLVAGFLFFIYQAMETNQMNPFTQDAPAASTPQVQDQ
ncbi:lamina-associated polypeptide 2, isoforms beta/gamma-like isoform X5 [Polyodon spathula]|uniref:lamina-associated polypeptide 2, isoforms beta/gamma-like isoform X5 n=1 Tax=Polyodon spathula TaxID=7913 RepID=UPI001B7E3C4A|nr:lamina-associated polypeptide 2, isoforms beta/gamma-like isoform X5 [Polyodon spathula]